MKHTIKLLTVAITLAAILTLTGCPGPVTPDKPCTHEHTRTEVIEEATCSKDGLGKIVCVDCEEVLDEQKLPIDPENHDWVLESDTANCYEDGVKTYKCNCNKTRTEDSTAHHHVDYETSGFCESCITYKFENRVITRVYTSTEEWQKAHPIDSLITTMQNPKPIYDECHFSFETNNDIPTNLNELIHLKSRYNGYRVYEFFNGAVWLYTDDIENGGVDIIKNNITEILLSQTNQ
jgi:hypothetical protein